ncbi:AP2 domain transcription factor AP2III-4 [Toxoplasma gondii ME49]|uniref:AP2 domain transcription factor AP2III-4 n=3 Tax=Toxoplasma gondii TaxID=5811 RepID=A0A125YYN7_TOXGV|nr:AP2 domain transcription factor AP2III-4 [Toxoplasma gondii ME49]EPT31633.1 AP2 domain transcription factor AP2III-4 [Toxoplasma gondii ME49]ESS30391.1 AP2 domain transcription factor AP2III-4 [Toxoplasma gondii VEG]KFG35274.1 AP2 domain transcription factor AP2III-4 [Toxoplasma gondii GAB2-2007-GAL-DOM2]|eukprot:XP_018638096.1 AP2 domain transcription factor AP2III-4 [Toxoplasma gondii ME49]
MASSVRTSNRGAPPGSLRRSSRDNDQQIIDSPPLDIAQKRSSDVEPQVSLPPHGGRSWRSGGEISSLLAPARIESSLITAALGCSPALASLAQRADVGSAAKDVDAESLNILTPASHQNSSFPSGLAEVPPRASTSPQPSLLGGVFAGLSCCRTTSAEQRSASSRSVALPPTHTGSAAAVPNAMALSPSLTISSGAVNSCLSLDEPKGLCGAGSAACTADATLGRLSGGAGASPRLAAAVPNLLSSVSPSSLFTSVPTGSAAAVSGSLSAPSPLSGHPWASLASAYCSRETLMGRTSGEPSLVSGSAGFIPTALQTAFHCGKETQGNGSTQTHASALNMQQVPAQTHGPVGHIHGRESLPKVVGVRYDKVNKTWRASWYDPQSRRRVERKFSVNKLGFINAYNMATECRKLQEQKLGLRDRTGRKQQQQQPKSPSVVTRAPAGVLGSASLPTCMPHLELQRHQELLAQTSSWAPAQPLGSDRLEKESLQQYLPFDFERALNSHHLSAGLDASGNFPSADASTIAVFSAATNSFLPARAPLNPVEERQRSPDLRHQHHMSVPAPPNGVKPEAHGGPPHADLSNAPTQQVQVSHLSDHLSGGSLPEAQTGASESGISRSSTRSRKRKDPPENSATPQSCRSRGTEDARTPNGGPGAEDEKAREEVIWMGGGGGGTRSRDQGRQLSDSQDPAAHEGGSHNGNCRHAGRAEGAGRELYSLRLGQRGTKIGTADGKSTGKDEGARHSGDDLGASSDGDGQTSQEEREDGTAKKPRLPSTNDESNSTKGGGKRSGTGDETARDGEPADKVAWVSKGTDKAVVKEHTYRGGGHTAGQGSREGGDPSKAGREEKPLPVVGDRTLSGSRKESNGGRSAGPEDTRETRTQFEKGQERREVREHAGDGSHRVIFSRLDADCGGRHCAGACRGVPNNSLSCAFTCQHLSPCSKAVGGGVCCCRRHSATLQESSCDTSCCSRRWTCTCCGDDCQGFPRPVARHGHHMKEECLPHGACGGSSGQESSLGSSSHPVSRVQHAKKTGWKPTGASPFQTASVSPSSCCPHHSQAEGGGELQGDSAAGCADESDPMISSGSVERDWFSSSSLAGDAPSNAAPTGPLLILHLTKELVLLLLQSVQDAVRALVPEGQLVEHFGKAEGGAEDFSSDRESDSLSGRERDHWRRQQKTRGEASPLKRDSTGAADRDKGSHDTGCEISAADARVCVAALERHKEIVRLATNVNSLGRYTRIFRVCIKNKQVPTQLPHLDLVQLLRQLLTLSSVERDTSSLGPTGSASGVDAMHARSTSSTEGSSGYMSPAESLRRLPGISGSTGLAREEKADCERTGVTPGRGGRVSRVTTAGTDEGGDLEDEQEGVGKSESGPLQGLNQGDTDSEGRLKDGGGPSGGGSRETGRVGPLSSSRLSSSRRGCEDSEQERMEERERVQTKHEHPTQSSHHHNTRSRSQSARIAASGRGGSSSHGAVSSVGSASLSSANRPSRAAAARRGFYNTRQQSTESPECLEIKTADAAAGKEERTSIKTELSSSSCSSGTANPTYSRGGAQNHRFLSAASSNAEGISSLASSQASPSPLSKLPPSICFGDRVRSDSSSGHSGDITNTGVPCSSEDGLNEGQDFDGAEGGSSREGESSVPDSLAQLLL